MTLVSLGPLLEVVTATGQRHRAAVGFGHEFDADLFVEAVTDPSGSPGHEGRGIPGPGLEQRARDHREDAT